MEGKTPTEQDQAPLLSVRNLHTSFRTQEGIVRAVNGVSFDLARGASLGIVGESGSGKSVLNLSIMGLIPSPPGRIEKGEVIFDGRDLLRLSSGELRALRGRRISMIFQDPMTSLNPFLRIGRQLAEVLEVHLRRRRFPALYESVRMLERVGIPAAAE
ncbi:MAG: ABC transporter ATP-binding protein, partial [Deltaproteobacteria bacterium]